MLATIECYNNQAEWLDQLRTYIDGNFVYLQKFLKDKLNIDYKIPEATYLGWIDISNSGIEMDELQYEMVEHQNVAIMDGKVYGNGGANHLRFNLGASEIKIQDGLDRLYKAFAVVQSNNEV
ncbi:aminotransferase class I/II-fold pyridoxal phosphate-dependent enzyme, partial [Weissella cibaria]|nr:aminotransferase class I/II-fold pyridoxal phosphate-dependent enzyme [Weissella cibaria]